MQMWRGWHRVPVLLSVELTGLDKGFFLWWEPAVSLPLIRLHSGRQHVTQSPIPFPPGPIWSTKMEASREYRETPATPLTLTLPLWSLNLNWLNELPIWEALVTAYWCVHRTPVCAPNGGDKIPSLVVCFPFSFLFLSLLCFSSFLSNYLSRTIYTKIQ